MPSTVSARILAAVDALPLRSGMRVLEIGCGPGVAAREIVRRWPDVEVLAIDRSEAAIRQAIEGSREAMAQGRLRFRRVAAEELTLLPHEPPYHLAFALRVGALDGRHPQAGALALPRIRAALVPGGRLFIDGGNPLRELALDGR
jgi:SAM-dependent methyltransferase